MPGASDVVVNDRPAQVASSASARVQARPLQALQYPQSKLEAVRTSYHDKTSRTLCNWQAAATICCNEHADHLFIVAPCGSGKTIAFTATLLFNPCDIVILISPLLSLSAQHLQHLVRLGVSTIELRVGSLGDKDLLSVRS